MESSASTTPETAHFYCKVNISYCLVESCTTEMVLSKFAWQVNSTCAAQHACSSSLHPEQNEKPKRMSQQPAPLPDTDAVVAEALAKHAHLPGALLPVLHGVQDALGHIPPEAVPEIARALNLSRAEVHGVLSYYSHFRQEGAGRHVLQICRAESCRAMGAESLLGQARAKLGCSDQRHSSSDGGYTVEPVYCLGLCASSPAVVLDGRLHARMTPERLDALLTEKGSV